jgi:hypothetical protein
MSKAPSRSISRRELLREPKRKLIIVCEGIRTEKLYFEAIKKHLRLASVDIQVLHAGATNPGAIVKFVDNMRTELKRERAWGGDDRISAVYDGMEHYRNNPDDWHKALDLAKAKQINLAITNPSFEFWYLIHFQDQNGWIERDEALKLLKNKHIPGYDKAVCYYPDPLEDRTEAAIERANQLVLQAQRNGQELPHCLCAEGVAKLVEVLLGLRHN